MDNSMNSALKDLIIFRVDKLKEEINRLIDSSCEHCWHSAPKVFEFGGVLYRSFQFCCKCPATRVKDCTSRTLDSKAYRAYKTNTYNSSYCDIPLDGPSAFHSALAEDGKLKEHILLQHPEIT